MGTGMQPGLTLAAAKAMAAVNKVIFGDKHVSRFLNRLAFGNYNKRFAPARTDKDWLSRDERMVDAYLKDERCTFLFTLNGYYNLFRSIEDASRPENLQKMPKDLPILFASGSADPVGNFGKGVEQVRKSFQAAGMEDVTWILYENDRHEILNETDRATVYKDLYAWLYVRLAEPRRKAGGKKS